MKYGFALNGYYIGAVDGDDYAGAVWVQLKGVAELLNCGCTMLDATAGEILEDFNGEGE